MDAELITRPRALTGTMQAVLSHLCATAGLWSDNMRVADSIPLECAHSRRPQGRLDLEAHAAGAPPASQSASPNPLRPLTTPLESII
ncbi:hypothetical protein ADENT20671_0966 [Actinomyces denticolens]|nr:hypothetical protein ADENT20671_0966 [Actinomyces denticolens]